MDHTGNYWWESTCEQIKSLSQAMTLRPYRSGAIFQINDLILINNIIMTDAELDLFVCLKTNQADH